MGSGDNSRSIGKLIIDLTPLLDVVLLILFIVLRGMSVERSELTVQEKNIEERENRLADEIASAEAERDSVASQLKTYENLGQYVNVLNIYSAYRPSDPRYRTVYVLINAEEPAQYELSPDNDKEKWSEIRSYIEENITETGAPIVLSIQSINRDENEKMLYRDEIAIKEIYEELIFDTKITTYEEENADE